jgi:hypothetical protein
MLVRVRELYHVEDEAAALAPEERRARRREQSVPMLAEIDRERRALAEVVLPKSPLGDALRYLGNQWDALQRFVDDGRLAIDNNRAYAARGISAGMPRPGLCRAGSEGSSIWAAHAGMAVPDAA